MEIILFVAMLILKYVITSLSFFILMTKREMQHKYVSFIPVLNSTFALGNISDSINKDYFKKTFNKFFLLISWIMSIILGGISIFLIKTYIPDLYEKIFKSVLEPNSNLNITNFNFSSQYSSMRPIILACSFLFVVFLIANFVLNFSCFYTIYREYNKKYSITYMLLAILGGCFLGLAFVPALLALSISKNTPVFEFLNKIKTTS